MCRPGGLIKGSLACAFTASRGHVLAASHVRLSFVACHLPAHEGKCAERNAALKKIMTKCEGLLGPGRRCFVLGDLNYRLDPTKFGDPAVFASPTSHHDAVSKYIHDADWKTLGRLDELARQPRTDAGLDGFQTPKLDFPPSFKVVVGSKGFHYQAKRLPGYTDRVLYRDQDAADAAIVCTDHAAIGDVTTSDHKPIRAAFEI